MCGPDNAPGFPPLACGYFRPALFRRPLSFIAFVVPGATAVFAQGDMRDTSIFMVPVSATYAYQVPGGDMSLRFGNNHNIGLSAAAKFKNNFFVGAEGSFLFGNRVHEGGLLDGLTNNAGQILDADGQPATVVVYERGYALFATVGKIVPVAGPNPNSGLLLKIGGGYLRHKIRIETQNNTVPQLEGDLLTGYDRLTAGPAALAFFGYQHIGNRRLINFVVGFEMMVGFTEPLRAFNFDTGTRETGTRYDALNGFRVGWTLPIHRRRADGYFYY